MRPGQQYLCLNDMKHKNVAIAVSGVYLVLLAVAAVWSWNFTATRDEFVKLLAAWIAAPDLGVGRGRVGHCSTQSAEGQQRTRAAQGRNHKERKGSGVRHGTDRQGQRGGEHSLVKSLLRPGHPGVTAPTRTATARLQS
jgi:hypothetical protein